MTRDERALGVLRWTVRAMGFAEFVAALWLWGSADLPWPLVLLALCAAVGVWCTFPEPHGPGQASERLRVYGVCLGCGGPALGAWCGSCRARGVRP